MLTYEELKKTVRKLVSLTNLTPEEFEYFCLHLSELINEFFLTPKQKPGRNVNENLVEVEKAYWQAVNRNCCLH